MRFALAATIAAMAAATGTSARAGVAAPPGVVGRVTSKVGGVTGTVGGLVGGLLGSPTAEPVPLTTQQVEAAFFDATNAERIKRGIHHLVVAGDLVAAARRQSVRMAANGDIWHNLHLEYEISDWHDLGENVGRGPTVEDIQIAFMASPHHRDNILDPTYTDVGVGASYSDNGLIFITLDFARRMPGAVPPATGTTTANRLFAHPDQPRSVSMLLELLSLDPQASTPARDETT